MKERISNNNKSFTVFNKLIINGFYTGSIGPQKIELIRKGVVPNNYKIVANLNSENRFEINFRYREAFMGIAAKTAFIFGIIFSLILISSKQYILPFTLIIVFIFSFLSFKIKERKEINYFSSKFLELYKSEFE